MCGITGLYAFNEIGRMHAIYLQKSLDTLSKRGPDYRNSLVEERVFLGHARLSIIDTSSAGHQPMTDASGRYTLIFNGEIYNFKELKAPLLEKGYTFHSDSDTEVLLYLLIEQGTRALDLLNGFFAFALYDREEQSLLMARDRMGIKPFLYYLDEDKFAFSSEMKALLAYQIPRQLDYNSLVHFLELNYIPAPDSIFQGVKKLMPGHFMRLDKQGLQIESWYEIPYEREKAQKNPISYEQAQSDLRKILEGAVQKRLVADVPLGSFLSGGIDSSIIATLAKKHKPDLHTFSIGYKDEPFFDETRFALEVAKKIGSEHQVFPLSNQDLFDHLFEVLDYTDEPFADSSALAVYILSKETKKHSTVALSGDGADELFSGYNKHSAFYRSFYPGKKENLVSQLLPILRLLPQSRSGAISNKIRQAERFARGMKMSPPERYWAWASFFSEKDALNLLSSQSRLAVEKEQIKSRESYLLRHLTNDANINDILRTDMELVLPNDMLTKVDLMSMANALEVRVPFLDKDLVAFVFSLPEHFKIDGQMRKKILQDAYREDLPDMLYQRPKKGFEVPLLPWMRKELKGLIMDDLLSDRLIEEQGIFDPQAIKKVKKKLFSSNPGDIHARVWGLIVFQWWWKKYMA